MPCMCGDSECPRCGVDQGTREEYSAWVHDLDNATKQQFKFLSYALRHAWDQRITGYIVTPAHEVINIRKGKRLSVDGKKWIPCERGL